MIIPDIRPFSGQHCETTATGTLLKAIGINLSEPMLFGLGEGLSFIVWKMKTMSLPFIGGRIKPNAITANIARNLNLDLHIGETTSVSKAWKEVKTLIDNNIPAGLKLDSFHLEYFTNKIHFAGHYATIYGYDEQYAYLIDTAQQGSLVKTSLKSLELARNEKGPMSSNNLWYTIQKTQETYHLPTAVKKALKANAREYLNPPIKNISFKGIQKASEEIENWFKQSKDPETDFTLTAVLMERAGTGGALFRNLYRDFLEESMSLLQQKEIELAYKEFKESAALWADVSALLTKAGTEHDIAFIRQASLCMKDISRLEKSAMEHLVNLV